MKEKVKKIREKKKQRKLAKKVIDGVKVIIITLITTERKIIHINLLLIQTKINYN